MEGLTDTEQPSGCGIQNIPLMSSTDNDNLLDPKSSTLNSENSENEDSIKFCTCEDGSVKSDDSQATIELEYDSEDPKPDDLKANTDSDTVELTKANDEVAHSNTQYTPEFKQPNPESSTLPLLTIAKQVANQALSSSPEIAYPESIPIPIMCDDDISDEYVAGSTACFKFQTKNNGPTIPFPKSADMENTEPSNISPTPETADPADPGSKGENTAMDTSNTDMENPNTNIDIPNKTMEIANTAMDIPIGDSASPTPASPSKCDERSAIPTNGNEQSKESPMKEDNKQELTEQDSGNLIASTPGITITINESSKEIFTDQKQTEDKNSPVSLTPEGRETKIEDCSAGEDTKESQLVPQHEGKLSPMEQAQSSSDGISKQEDSDSKIVVREEILLKKEIEAEKSAPQSIECASIVSIACQDSSNFSSEPEKISTFNIPKEEKLESCAEGKGTEAAHEGGSSVKMEGEPLTLAKEEKVSTVSSSAEDIDQTVIVCKTMEVAKTTAPEAEKDQMATESVPVAVENIEKILITENETIQPCNMSEAMVEKDTKTFRSEKDVTHLATEQQNTVEGSNINLIQTTSESEAREEETEKEVSNFLKTEKEIVAADIIETNVEEVIKHSEDKASSGTVSDNGKVREMSKAQNEEINSLTESQEKEKEEKKIDSQETVDEKVGNGLEEKEIAPPPIEKECKEENIPCLENELVPNAPESETKKGIDSRSSGINDVHELAKVGTKTGSDANENTEGEGKEIDHTGPKKDAEKEEGPKLPNFLLCTVCHGLFKDPVVLPCAHVFCRPECVKRLFTDFTVTCAVCSEKNIIDGGVGFLPQALTFHLLAQQMRSTHGTKFDKEMEPLEIPEENTETEDLKAVETGSSAVDEGRNETSVDNVPPSKELSLSEFMTPSQGFLQATSNESTITEPVSDSRETQETEPSSYTEVEVEPPGVETVPEVGTGDDAPQDPFGPPGVEDEPAPPGEELGLPPPTKKRKSRWSKEESEQTQSTIDLEASIPDSDESEVMPASESSVVPPSVVSESSQVPVADITPSIPETPTDSETTPVDDNSTQPTTTTETGTTESDQYNSNWNSSWNNWQQQGSGAPNNYGWRPYGPQGNNWRAPPPGYNQAQQYAQQYGQWQQSYAPGYNNSQYNPVMYNQGYQQNYHNQGYNQQGNWYGNWQQQQTQQQPQQQPQQQQQQVTSGTSYQWNTQGYPNVSTTITGPLPDFLLPKSNDRDSHSSGGKKKKKRLIDAGNIPLPPPTPVEPPIKKSKVELPPLPETPPPPTPAPPLPVPPPPAYLTEQPRPPPLPMETFSAGGPRQIKTAGAAAGQDEDIPHRHLYVGNLPEGTKAAMLRDALGCHGKVATCKIAAGKGANAGIFAFVTIETHTEPSHLVSTLNGWEFNGTRLKVKKLKNLPGSKS